MASLISKASLLMVPSVYEDGTLYNVLPSGNKAPDETGSHNGYDQTRADFTFSRGSNLAATRVNSDGLIEKGRENIVLQSNSFDTTWTRTSSTLTSGQSGYDGSSDAWLLTKSANGGRIQQNVSSGLYTFSVYAKANASSWLRLLKGGNASAYFDLTNGVVGTTSTDIDATITLIENDWYRCSLTYNDAYAGSVRIYPADADDDVTGTSGSIYIQDAQVEKGLVATDYIETGSTTAQAGILEDMPRINYDANGENGALLLESSRTNLITNSEYFGAWTNTRTTDTINAGKSPEGINNASLITDDSTASSSHFVRHNSVSLTSGTSYTFSIYAKSNGRNVGFNLDTGVGAASPAIFDLSSGTVFNSGNFTTSIIDAGDGWYRCIGTFTASATATSFIYVRAADAGGVTVYDGDGVSGFYAYGAQLESGSYSSSLIPTHGAAVTRGADSQTELSVPNGSSTQGTILYEFDKAQAPTSYDIVPLKVGTNRILRISQYNPNMRFSINENATSYDESNSYNSHIKVAVSYSSSSVKLFINGVLRATDTTYSASGNVIIPANGLQATNIGCSLESKQLTYFPEALTDAECVTLTTL